jgi:hypothetical protein
LKRKRHWFFLYVKCFLFICFSVCTVVCHEWVRNMADITLCIKSH